MTTNTPDRLTSSHSQSSSLLGWIGLGFVIAITTFFTSCLGNEAASRLLNTESGAPLMKGVVAGLPPCVLALSLCGYAVLSAAVPRAGLGYVLIGLAGIIYVGHPIGILQAELLIASGVALGLSHPEPRRLAIRLAWMIPLGAALISALFTVALCRFLPQILPSL